MGIFSKNKKDDDFLYFEPDNDKIGFSHNESNIKPNHVLTPEEVVNTFSDDILPIESGALDSLKARMHNIQASYKEEKAEQPKETLLEKCKPFITDNENQEPFVPSASYKLESVAEILSAQSKQTLDKLSAKYDISFDDLGKYSFSTEKATEPTEKAKPKKEVTEEPQIFNEVIKPTANENTIFISDIDTVVPKSHTSNLENTATIKFTPVTDGNNTGRISISSMTKPIDLTGEIIQISSSSTEETDNELHLELSEFEEYKPDEELKTEADAKVLNRSLSIKKRSSFIRSSLSVIFTLLISIGRLPFMTGLILSSTKASMIVFTAFAFIIAIVNCDSFLSVKKLFSRKVTADISVVFSSLFVFIYAIYGIIKDEIIIDILILYGIILSIRAISGFFKNSYLLSNFRQIASSNKKSAIKLISDHAVTFAMAKKSIDGDIMIAAPQTTSHIDDYMKFSTFGNFFGGKFAVVSIVSVVISIFAGLAGASYFDSALYGLYCSAVVQCLTALPAIFLIDNLPIYRASKKLNRIGAMIAGKTGAEFIEKANAVVLSANEIFPAGSVTLHQMKVLSENNLEDTIIRAASLTECMASPLAPIFKKIAGTGNITTFPNSDTVKYEDRMGISGWVDNRLLFIGNRTLMEAHGISVPNVEVDRKILRSGFFPVYVASGDKACALLMVQYSVNPETAHQLRRLSSTGITMLVNSSDPNLTEEMICDYMGLYDDTVLVMSSAGVHMYKNATAQTKSCPAPAAHKGHSNSIATILNCASRIKKSNIILTLLYSVLAVLGVVLFIYMSFDSSGDLVGAGTVLTYSLISTLLSYLFYLIERP